jgi:TPR repeat protein
MNGSDKAQFIVASFYEKGNFGEVNIEEALKWYKASASQGNEMAEKSYNELSQRISEANNRIQSQIAYQNKLNLEAYEQRMAEQREYQKKQKRKELIKNTALILGGAAAVTGVAIGASRRRR